MALKLYFQNAAAPFTPPTKRGAWDDITEVAGVHGLGDKSGAWTSEGVYVPVGTDYDFLVTRFVSSPLTADTLFSGAIEGVIGVTEANVGLKAHLHLHVFVLQGQTDTLRGTLWADYIDPDEAATDGSVCGEAFAGTLTTLQARAGDTVVVEAGVRCNADSTRIAQIWWSGTGADLTDGATVVNQPGWIQLGVQEGVQTAMSFSATGGTKSIDGDYTVHVFTADGTLECTGEIEAEVLVVAGGGSGSRGGGGAGGYLTGTETLTGTMPVTVGAGGESPSSTHDGYNGGDSVFGTRTAKGGGGGGAEMDAGLHGGAGGGAGDWGTLSGGTPESGQGYAGGGTNSTYTPFPSGGGGGAGGAGVDGVGYGNAGAGGAGLNNDIVQRGADVGYAGGGGGGCQSAVGVGGSASHGGGAGAASGAGTAGTANTGGGGGACNGTGGGAGGSGIVVVRYLTPSSAPSFTPQAILV